MYVVKSLSNVLCRILKCHILKKKKIECPIGYYGGNCSEACKFPHFGKEC